MCYGYRATESENLAGAGVAKIGMPEPGPGSSLTLILNKCQSSVFLLFV